MGGVGCLNFLFNGRRALALRGWLVRFDIANRRVLEERTGAPADATDLRNWTLEGHAGRPCHRIRLLADPRQTSLSRGLVHLGAEVSETTPVVLPEAQGQSGRITFTFRATLPTSWGGSPRKFGSLDRSVSERRSRAFFSSISPKRGRIRGNSRGSEGTQRHAQVPSRTSLSTKSDVSAVACETPPQGFKSRTPRSSKRPGFHGIRFPWPGRFVFPSTVLDQGVGWMDSLTSARTLRRRRSRLELCIAQLPEKKAVLVCRLQVLLGPRRAVPVAGVELDS
jgi:hypothetical protein